MKKSLKLFGAVSVLAVLANADVVKMNAKAEVFIIDVSFIESPLNFIGVNLLKLAK